jgi:predicted lipoprotein with Yx(FWY)xxD motif
MAGGKMKRLATTGVSAVVALVAACAGEVTAAQAAPPPATVHAATIRVGNQSMTVLENASGRTLYYYTPDTSTRISCTGSCAKVWPPLLQPSGTPTSASSLPGRLTVLSGPNGRQVLYAGHPLYTYSKDTGPGQASGQGVAGRWFVAATNVRQNM